MGRSTPSWSTFLYETQGYPTPRKDVQNIHLFLPCLLLSAFCMRITGVSCKHTFITFVNHSWIVWSTWGKYHNHQFDMNINVWHAGGSVSPKQLIALQSIPLLDQTLWNWGASIPHCGNIHFNRFEIKKTKNILPPHPTPALLVIPVIPRDSWYYRRLQEISGDSSLFPRMTEEFRYCRGFFEIVAFSRGLRWNSGICHALPGFTVYSWGKYTNKINVGNRGCLHRGSLMYAGGGGQKKCLK